MIKQLHPVEPEELMAYVDGELSPERAARAEAHVEGCAECRTLAEDLRGVSKAMEDWRADSNGKAYARLSAEVVEWERRSRTRTTRWTERLGVAQKAFSWKLVPLYSATVLLLAVACLHFIGSNADMVFSSAGEGRVASENKSQRVEEAITLRNFEKDSNHRVGGQGDQMKNSFSVDGQITGAQPMRRIDQYAERNRPPSMQPPSAGPTSATIANAASSSAIAERGPMIIRTADVSIIAKDFGQARARVEQIVGKHRGYIGSLQAGGAADGGRTLQASLRIPSDQLDGALAEIKTLGRVQSESQNGQEVTAQYVDLQARLSNSRNTEQRLIDLLREPTGKLSDVLAVENELARVRGEIEQMEAERKSLLNQVSFSTLNATITEDYQAQLQVVPPSTSTRLINAAVEGYRSMVDGILSVALFLLSAAPSLILWAGILFFPARFAWKRFRRVAQ